MLAAHLVKISRKDLYRHQITDLYGRHKLIYSMFECDRSEEQLKQSEHSGFNWVELPPSPFGESFLIISEKPIHQVPGVEIQTKCIPEKLFEFDTYKFSIRIVPCYRKPLDISEREKGKRGKLVYLLNKDKIEEWFSKRALQSGFEVVTCSSSPVKRQSFKKGNDEITISSTDINGILKVVDREKFKQTFKRGMGRGRAFGCGLLKIVKIN